MFTERKNRVGTAYRMLLSLKTSVKKKKLTSRRTTVSVVKQPSSHITRTFAGHCPMYVASIQACQHTFLLEHLIKLRVLKHDILNIHHPQML